MRFNHLLGNGEPESEPTALFTIRFHLLEYFSNTVLWNAFAGISDPAANKPLGIRNGRTDRYFSVARVFDGV